MLILKNLIFLELILKGLFLDMHILKNRILKELILKGLTFRTLALKK